MRINIQDDILKIHSLGLLDTLLVDKTTGRNIMWATDAYNNFGEKYARNERITTAALINSGRDVIKSRARKAMEHQSERTKQHAEVFTPIWICLLMNNRLDEEWFGKDNIFEENGVPTDKIIFPEGKTWKDYIDSRRMEITCGEAPFVVNRYDVETGEVIPIKRRFGFLDRKLRVVNENTDAEDEWLTWTIRAFQSTYAYEFQGDNLLISRVNLLMTFEEYYEDRWNRKPSIEEYRKLVNIIVWNIWQMDGLTGTVPYSKAREQFEQVSVFDLFDFGEERQEEEETNPPCRIYDWRANKSLEFRDLKTLRG